MGTVIWDQRGFLLVDFMEPGIITPEVYWETLSKLRSVIQNRQHRMLTSGIVLLHNNAVHTAQKNSAIHMGILEHPPYSPNLAPSDFCLLLHFKKWLGSQQFNESEELKAAVLNWLKSKAVDFYAEGIKKLVPWYKKCLEKTVEK